MPNRIPAEGKYNFIDLFAGAGGLSEGFIQAGFNPIAHVEMNSFAAQTLVTRSAYYYLKQVKQLDIYYQYLRGEITRDAFLEKIPNRITKTVICETMSNDTLPGIFKTIDGIMKLRNMQSVDVVIGGPPCQAYSLVGRAQSSHMDHPMSEDPRNELYKLYARVLKRYQPRMFVFENVMGISSANEGTTFKNLKKYLRRVGYEIEWHEQNSKSFGVLQNRRRMIIVGWLKNSGMAYPEFLKKESPFTVNDIRSIATTLGENQSLLIYSKKHGAGIECNFRDFVDPRKPDTDFGWRPFQIAFILMNLSGIVNPEHKDRDVVDLLYFPTGGGKTEAYLGLMAFVIANRRLRASDASEYNADGGVTAMLRYTLRLLTTQQRDRITKMVVAAELIRQKTYPKYGKEPISIGFWVGGGVTPNKFDELVEKADKPGEARRKRNLLYKQLLTCPFCGKPLTEDEFYIDPDRKSVAIYCADRNCMFYKYKQDRIRIPVYLVDEEIYAKCPTIILSTVDKFARLPWDVKTNALFGRVDRVCSRDGYVAIGEEHKRHNRTQELPASTLTPIRPFLPPELIIQDELHLITGPLGTVYGAYETIIEDMCTYGDKRIKPKYVVSTATIKNASEQTRCLYARQSTAQFPPNGFEIGDSFFINEISTKDDPFRKYVGVCAPGQSVKTTLLRMYAIILQTSYQLAQQDEYKNVIDPYYSLVGYYNSIRELGGAVRLLQDDIPKRIYRIKTKYNMDKVRYLNKKVEITSRMSSYEIPNKLRQLEATCDSKDCLDTAVATNMIAVGMDVDRLGLMVVTGQPKQNSEYIQATSRIGRAFPGLVFTLYNPYRPRDLSHYENFTGYHSQLYRFVEGTTATPFSARARDRVMHALIISAIRLKYPEMASNERAADIAALSDIQMSEIKALILDRLNIVKPEVRLDAENEIDQFIDWWKMLAAQGKPLRYYVYGTDKYNRLMNYYGQSCKDTEKATLSSMREVENAANMFYYTEE